MRTLGVKEAAEFLWIHKITFYKMAKSGHVPAMRQRKRPPEGSLSLCFMVRPKRFELLTPWFVGLNLYL